MNESDTPRTRLDKWLWAARFFKTRALAAHEIEAGRVRVNDQAAKSSREVRPGDRIDLRQGHVPRCVIVKVAGRVRGPAAEAALLYDETPESIAERERIAAARRLAPEPAASLDQGRPTKRDRRQLAQWDRWSATSED